MTKLETFFWIHRSFDPIKVGLDRAFLMSLHMTDLDWTKDFSSWDAARKKIALEQLFYFSKGIEIGIDGLEGPQTTAARKAFSKLK